jgi:hypothetical protein
VIEGIEHLETLELLRTTDDPHEANHEALDLSLLAARAGREAATLELHRKDFQLGLRDEYMQGGMNKTNADDAVRQDKRYVEYAERIVALEEVAAQAKAWSRYFGARVEILMTEAASGV